MKSYVKVFETALETDETISPEEFLARREAGTIRTEGVEIVPPAPGLPWGGFRVTLDTPRYRVRSDKEECHVF